MIALPYHNAMPTAQRQDALIARQEQQIRELESLTRVLGLEDRVDFHELRAPHDTLRPLHDLRDSRDAGNGADVP